MALLDLLGRRWALRILWELRGRTLNFRELRERCDSMSPSVLNARLADMREAAVVELTDDGYRLTDDGEELLEAFTPVSAWAKRWGRRMARSRMSA
jgi:DNA-binding HxlR family transcriptional regulator